MVRFDRYKNYYNLFLSHLDTVHDYEAHTDSNFSSSTSFLHLLILAMIYLWSDTTTVTAKTAFRALWVIRYKPDMIALHLGTGVCCFSNVIYCTQCPSVEVCSAHVSQRPLSSYTYHPPVERGRMLAAERHVLVLGQLHRELIPRGASLSRDIFFSAENKVGGHRWVTLWKGHSFGWWET